MTILSAYKTLEDALCACSSCGVCTKRCEVLDTAEKTVGSLAALFLDTAKNCNLEDAQQSAQALQNIQKIACESPEYIFAVRRCCMCSFCTAEKTCCVNANEVFTAIRELFAFAGITNTQGFESTQVDREWDIFSVYRAVYGIGYPDLPHIEQAEEFGADTLFYPGCPLVSYAPSLTRAVYAKLGELGYSTVISEACCGSPLKSAGMADRAKDFREGIVKSALNHGVTRIVCVCPGCMSELKDTGDYAQSIDFVALPEILVQANMSISEETIASVLGGLDENPDLKVSVFDSCNDREGDFGNPVRALIPQQFITELEHNKEHALCCGAGGAVVLVDPDICNRRVKRAYDEASASCDIVITECPTCSYTLASYARSNPEYVKNPQTARPVNYLELVFGVPIDWPGTFERLESMWSGEYGAWVCQQLS